MFKTMKRNGGSRLSLFSFFLTAGSESSLRPTPLLEAELSGVNHLVNSSSLSQRLHLSLVRLSLISEPGRLVVLLAVTPTLIDYSLSVSVIM